MPRPTAAQLAYGSATVVFSTVALLLFSRTTTGLGVALVGVVSLLLGVLVTLSVPAPRRARAAAGAAADGAPGRPAPRVPRPRAHAEEHSLRR
ncbi:hypothetical protein ACF1G0_20735 [Streptomyces sp. NPDC013953]|uniref:hypothetical protein n=1 Tax=Streptomyces sp. NPDC013953 TaxID=3364868 RepID=UPI0036F6AD81